MLKSVLRLRLAILLALLLAGCATQPTTPPQALPTLTLGQAVETAGYYLNNAKNSDGQERQGYLLLAARAYIKSGQIDAANALLNTLAPQLSQQGQLQVEYRLLTARIALEQNQRAEALSLLQWPTFWGPNAQQWQDYYRLLVIIHQQAGDALATAAAHFGLSPYLNSLERPGNQDALWRNLSQLDQETLRINLDEASDPQWRGWLELAWLVQSHGAQPSALISELSQWQYRNPAHPASRRLPSDLEVALTTQPHQPNQIGVLLPLTGRVATQAKVIQQGIMASVLGQTSPKKVVFYDTNKLSASSAYQLALAEGSEFIIGPLLKTNIDEVLALYDGRVPMLTLNSREEASPTTQGLYFFGLKPETEAAQAADRIWRDGLQRPLVIAANNAIGKRMADSFVEEWQQFDQSEPEIHYFNNSEDMRAIVQKALHVDLSKQRIKQIEALFGQSVEADFRSRRDIDALYLIANGEETRLLKPFVDISQSVFARPPTIYASSRSADGNQEGSELDGMKLSDMPWLLEENEAKDQSFAIWPERSNALWRLYALGYDSWHLIDRLAQMRAFNGYRTIGLSGELTATPDGEVQRELAWARFAKGKLRRD